MQLSRYGGGVPRGPDTARSRATRLTLSWDGRGVRLTSSLEEVILPRKEVIQPHLPVRLPCYDFTPLTNHPSRVGPTTSGAIDSGGVTGGVYKARELIHRGVLIRDY